MYGLYQILFTCFMTAYVPVVLLRMALKRKYLDSFRGRLALWPRPLRERVRRLERPVWIHSLSLGETLSAVPLVRAVRREYPDLPLVFSTSTETGQAAARARLAQMVQGFLYLPLDLDLAMTTVVHRVRPRLFVLVETDLWPGLLHVLRRNAVPAAFVNVRFSARSRNRFRMVRPFAEEVLRAFYFIGAQTEQDARRLEQIGALPQATFVTGNMKFDAELLEVSQEERVVLARDLGLRYGEQPIVVCGSTHEGEELVLLRVLGTLRRTAPDVALVLAPRDKERFEAVARMAEAMGFKAGLRSQPPQPGRSVVVLDTMGELRRVYAVASLGFVGGTLVPVGGHNLLEPAIHGKPVLYGPHTHRTASIAQDLEREGAGVRVSGERELADTVLRLLGDGALRERMGARGRSFCIENRGAVERTLRHIRVHL